VTQTQALLLAAVLIFAGLYFVTPRRVRRDRQRRFNARQRAVILARAGYRCEATFLGFRCRRRGRLQCDHVKAWARGGRTRVDNGQCLCRLHNLTKGARPVGWVYRWRLKRRRFNYR
jgi:hypothetical protein